MKKRSMWIVFLAALLCLTMLFVSCESKDNTDDKETKDPIDTSDTDDTNPTEPDEKTPEPEKVDYAALIKKWTNYIAYQTPEQDDEMPTDLKNFYNSDTTEWFDAYGDLCLILDTQYDNSNYYNVYKVYNLKTGELVFKEESSWLSGGYTDDRVDYEVDFFGNADYAIFRVIKTEEIYDEETNARNYSYFATYYDANGIALADTMTFDDYYDAEDSIQYEYVGSGILTIIGDKAFVCRDGEIFTVFNKLEMRGLPDITLEYADMYYSIGDDMIWVFDKNYDELISYSYGDFAWDSATPYVLSNGNILIEMTANVEEETKGAFYDPFYDEYHCFKQVLIDPAKGTVTDLDVTFWIDEMITPANDDEEIAIVGDCQIASVWKISEEGIISNDLSYLALDNEMKVKEELPAILENQCGLLGAIDSTTFIVPSAVEDPDYARFYENYKINTTDGKIELLEIDSDYFYDGHYQYVTGGVIINDVLYNEKNEEIVDLRYVYNYTVQGEDVIMVQEDENSRSTRFLWIENGAAVYSNYFDASQTRQPMLSGAFFTVQTFDEVTGDWIYNLYNRFGQKILSGDYISETWIGDERGIECMWYDDLGDLHYSYYIVK